MDRRDLLRLIPTGTALGCANLLGGGRLSTGEGAQEQKSTPAGLPPLKITDVSTILTAPDRIRLVVVKVSTSEPGLYGLGCATFTQRALAVQTAVDKYLKPFLIGRDADEIEDIWQSSYVSSYWRNGPVLFNAMSGVDMALWDIKGKRAGMPVYQLLGGKCRFAAALLCPHQRQGRTRAGGQRRAAMAKGYRHVRVQIAIPGMATYGTRRARGPAGRVCRSARRPAQRRAIWEPARSCPQGSRSSSSTSADQLGDDVELLHDVHERVSPSQAIKLCKDLEQYRLFFLEDPLPPEDNDHFHRLLRQQCAHADRDGRAVQYPARIPPADRRSADRLHPHPYLADRRPEHGAKGRGPGEFFGVKTAWHGPGDVSPVGHAAGLALELATHNFGIHEGGVFPDRDPRGLPRLPRNPGRLHVRQRGPRPGYRSSTRSLPPSSRSPTTRLRPRWGATRRRDGTVIRP